MIQKLNQVLNVSSREWPRILVAWCMTFLTRFGFILGWTVLIATFLSHVGIQHLPILFLVNATLVMGGTMIFRNIVHKIRKEVLITFTILAATAFLVASIAFINTNTLFFFSLLLVAESVLLAQLSILISLFLEDIFSPLESQRTFPIVESAETIGGIAGGLALSFFANSLPAYKFIIIWALALLLILPIVLRFNTKTLDVPKLKISKENKERNKLHESFFEMRKVPFLKGLMLVVLLHWSIMNVVEFQYTKAIQQDIYMQQEETLVLEGESEEEIILASAAYTEAQMAEYEHKLTEKLGKLHVIFNSAALLIQLILASRIITSMGVISSMLLHPLITLLNLLGLSLRFNLLTAALTRGSYELTGLIFKNSYDSSYYAIPHEKRSDVKELMQGIMKPLGAIIGTLTIIIIALNTSGIIQTFALNISIVAMGIMMAGLIFSLRKKYTEMSEHNLSRKMDLPTRLNAIEILAQNGHDKLTPALQKILKRESEPEVIKRGILHTLGDKQDLESVNTILEFLSSDKDGLRLAAVRALSKFNKLEKNLMSQTFTRHRIVDRLKEALEKEQNENIKEEMVKALYKIAPDKLTDYLLDAIRDDSKNRASLIRMLKLFEDPNLKYYLEKYLEGKSSELKAASIIALWQLKDIRTRLSHYLKQMLDSPKTKVIKLGIETCGEIKYMEAKARLKKFLTHPKPEIQEAAVLALAKMGDESIVPHLVGIFSDPGHEWFKNTSAILDRFSKRFKAIVKNTLHLHVVDVINAILAKNKSIENMSKETLLHLKSLYHQVNAHHEEHKIQLALDSSDEE